MGLVSVRAELPPSLTSRAARIAQPLDAVASSGALQVWKWRWSAPTNCSRVWKVLPRSLKI